MSKGLGSYIYIYDVALLLLEVVGLTSTGHFFDGFCQFSKLEGSFSFFFSTRNFFGFSIAE